jgi:hypothetical protein
MTEAQARRGRDAAAMPSWSTSDVGKEQAATPPDDPAAAELESARRLLEQLFAEPSADDQSTQPEQ